VATESEVMGCLDKVYGFKMNEGRILGKHRRISWNWSRPSSHVLVPNVVHWRVGGFFSSDLVAASLGLLPGELEQAIGGTFSRSCLILVLLIYQMHRFLDIRAALEHRTLLNHYREIIDLMDAEPVGKPCCELLAKFKTEVQEFGKNPDTTLLARDLTAILAPLRCPDSRAE